MSTITAISTEIVVLPVSAGPIRFVDNVVVHVDTEDGVRGSTYVWTPSVRSGPEPPPASVVFLLQTAVRTVATAVIGEDVFAYERIRQKIAQLEINLGQGVLTTAYSGVDMAIWDALCKLVGQPLYRMLGGSRDAIPFYTTELAHQLAGEPEEVAAAAAMLADRGHKLLKVPIVGLAADAAVARLRAVRDAVPDIGLAADLGSSLHFDQALRLCRRFETFQLEWIEDPLPLDRVDEYVSLRRAVSTPIASGETGYSHALFRNLMERRALDLVIFEPMRAGGITGARRLSALAEAFDVAIKPHLYHNLSVQLLAAFPTGSRAEYLPWWDVLLAEPVTPRDGFGTPSDRPGIGLDFDPDAIARYAVGARP